MSEKYYIKVTKETSSDDAALLVQWHIKNGLKVKLGDAIVSLETSKAVFDIEAPVDGYLYYNHSEGDEVAIGEIIAVITDKKESTAEAVNLNKIEDTDGIEETKFSKKALKLISENDLDKKLFFKKGLVSEKDVKDYIETESIKIETNLTPEEREKKILIFGAGGHAKMCIDILRQSDIYEIYGIIDDYKDIGFKVLGVPVLGREKDLKDFYDKGFSLIVNGVGAAASHPIREKIFNNLKEIGFELPNIIHPKASIEPSAALGEGNQVMANATIGSDVNIGNNCIINSGTVVSHDCSLGDNVHIAPGAILAGTVRVGKNTLVGMNATIYMKVSLGNNVTIYNGCNIFANVENNVEVKPQDK